MVKKDKINFEIPAFVLGIVGIVLILSYPIGSLVLGIIGLVFAYKQKTRLSYKAKILNVISIVLGLALVIISIISFLNNPSSSLF